MSLDLNSELKVVQDLHTDLFLELKNSKIKEETFVNLLLLWIENVKSTSNLFYYVCFVKRYNEPYKIKNYFVLL